LVRVSREFSACISESSLDPIEMATSLVEQNELTPSVFDLSLLQAIQLTG